MTFVQLSRKHILRFVSGRISPGVSLIVQRSFNELSYSAKYKNERSHLELVKDIIHYVGNHRFPLVPLTTELHPEIEITPPEEDDESAVRPYSESFSSNSGKWEFRFLTDESKMKESEDLNAIKSTSLFSKGYQVLLDYVLLSEDCQDLNDHFPVPVASALYALENFYVNRGHHEMRLKTVCSCFLAKDKTLTETDIASVFTKHLFSQLITGQTNYYLDLQFKGKTDGCPCGCGDILNFGYSQLGSRELFHGSADLVIFPGETDVFTDVNNGNIEHVECALFALNKNDENAGHNKVEKEWYHSEEFTESEKDKSARESRLNGFGFSARHQIKQAISMSLCKRNRFLHRSNSDEKEVSITPVCGFNGRSYTLSLYDAEDDYLLKMAGSLDLFRDVFLKSSAILDIWLFIYHHLFCSKPPESVLNQLKGSCGLKHHLGERMYEYVLKDSDWRYDLYRPGSKVKSRRILDDIDSNTNIRFMDESIDFNSDAKQILKDRLPFREQVSEEYSSEIKRKTEFIILYKTMESTFSKFLHMIFSGLTDKCDFLFRTWTPKWYSENTTETPMETCLNQVNYYWCFDKCCKDQSACFKGYSVYGPYCIDGNEAVGIFFGVLLVICIFIAIWNNLYNYQFVQATRRRW